MAKKANAMHKVAPDAGGFGDPNFMLPASIKDNESPAVEDTANTGRAAFGSDATSGDDGRELGT